MTTDILDLLTDAVHYDRFRSPFHGDGAQFACLYSTDGPVGIGPVHARAAQLTRFVTQTTLQLWVKHDGAWQAVHRQIMRSHPAVAEENARWRLGGTELDVRARTVYAGERTAWHEQIVTNAGDAAIELQLAATGQIDPERELRPAALQRLGIRPAPRQPFVEVTGNTVRVGYRGEPRLPCPALQIDGVEGIPRAERRHLPVWAPGPFDPCADHANPPGSPALHYALYGQTQTLAPLESARLVFRLSYVPAWHAAPQHVWPGPVAAAPDLDALAADAGTGLRARLASSAHDSRLARARYALQRCSYRGRDATYGPNRSCLCTPGITAFSITYFWDALFSVAAIVGFDPDYARQALRVPLIKVNDRYAQRNWDWRLRRNEAIPQPQAPIASWALAHYLALHDDEAYLAETYPQLAALHRFWETQDADGDGLPEWCFTGLNADNGPHYLPYMPYQVHNVYLPPIASVSLASFLHLDALLLGQFADRLGRTKDIHRWQARAAFLAERLKAVCWHPEDRCFYDYDHHLAEHRRVKTHLLFWPLWAGVPMDAEDKRYLIEDVLLDPTQFNGPIPFPTCAYDAPEYGPEIYWSGRSWPHITYWLVEMLVREGYRDAALAAADRWLAWQSAHTGHREAVTTNPHLTEYCENSDFSYRTGRDFDYNWAAAAVALLRERRYDTYVPLR